MGSRTPAGLCNIDFPRLSGKAPASDFPTPSNLNSHNHNQHAGRPCFSLAVLVGLSGSQSQLAPTLFSDLSIFSDGRLDASTTLDVHHSCERSVHSPDRGPLPILSE